MHWKYFLATRRMLCNDLHMLRFEYIYVHTEIYCHILPNYCWYWNFRLFRCRLWLTKRGRNDFRYTIGGQKVQFFDHSLYKILTFVSTLCATWWFTFLNNFGSFIATCWFNRLHTNKLSNKWLAINCYPPNPVIKSIHRRAAHGKPSIFLQD